VFYCDNEGVTHIQAWIYITVDVCVDVYLAHIVFPRGSCRTWRSLRHEVSFRETWNQLLSQV